MDRYALAKRVFRNKAFKKTDLSMKTKFEMVFNQLKKLDDFQGLSITWQSLQGLKEIKKPCF